MSDKNHLIPFLVAGTRAAATGTVHAANRLQPGPHEIRLDGVIRSVDAAKHQVVLDVGSFTLPNGRSKPLGQYTGKIVLVGAGASVHQRGDLKASIKLQDLKVGQVAVVIGRDLGSGQPLPLREMLVWSPVAATAPEPPPSSSVEPDA